MVLFHVSAFWHHTTSNMIIIILELIKMLMTHLFKYTSSRNPYKDHFMWLGKNKYIGTYQNSVKKKKACPKGNKKTRGDVRQKHLWKNIENLSHQKQQLFSVSDKYCFQKSQFKRWEVAGPIWEGWIAWSKVRLFLNIGYSLMFRSLVFVLS